VPADKVVSRYHRSLGLLRDAVRHTDRAYFFDTSGEEEAVFLGEVEGGRTLTLIADAVPPWFQTHLLDKF